MSLKAKEVKAKVLLVDPPWKYDRWSTKNGKVSHKLSRGAAKHYNTLKISDLARLDVQSIMNNQCMVFMWGTWPKLFDGVQPLMEAWGLRYLTVAWTWVKTTKNGKLAMGLGHYTRSCTEPCFLATNGYPIRPENKSVKNVIFSERQSLHSAKPEIQYEIIEKLYPNLNPKVELFARNKRDGWLSWGEEIESDFELEFLPKVFDF